MLPGFNHRDTDVDLFSYVNICHLFPFVARGPMETQPEVLECIHSVVVVQRGSLLDVYIQIQSKYSNLCTNRRAVKENVLLLTCPFSIRL